MMKINPAKLILTSCLIGSYSTFLSAASSSNYYEIGWDNINTSGIATSPAYSIKDTVSQAFATGKFSSDSFSLQTGFESLPVSSDNPLRISINARGEEPIGNSYWMDISADGRYVVFESDASNLVDNDDNGLRDIFLKDKQTGFIKRVSTSANEAESNGTSGRAKISADGNYVVFQSTASNLVIGDTNGAWDIFRKNVNTGNITRVSTDNTENQSRNNSYYASINADGRYVVFESQANDLVPGDNNDYTDVFYKDMQTGTLTRISTDSNNQQANDESQEASISGDGRYVVFSSTANNLVADDSNNASDIFLKDLQTGTTTRVSTDIVGSESNGSSRTPVISANGLYMVFISLANNLVINDDNNYYDIYVKNLVTSEIVLASSDNNGVVGNRDSSAPDISADGRYIVFQSTAYNLAAEDKNNKYDVFVKDLLTANIERISTNSNGEEGQGHSRYPVISDDGYKITYYSNASNIVTNDENGAVDIFQAESNVFDTDADGLIDAIESALGSDINNVDTDNDGLLDGYEYEISTSPTKRDTDNDGLSDANELELNTNPTMADTDGDGLLDGQEVGFANDPLVADVSLPNPLRISLSTKGKEVNDHSYGMDASADGRYVVFESDASNLVGDDGNGFRDIFLKDTQLGTMIRVSTTSDGSESDGTSRYAKISADGQYVLFQSTASNLVNEDTNGAWDIFRKNIQTGQIIRISTDNLDRQSNHNSYHANISAEGRYVVFESAADNLVSSDSNELIDVFYKDLLTGSLTRVSVGNVLSLQGNGDSRYPSISDNGQFVVFESSATNLVMEADENNASDIFLKDMSIAKTTRISKNSFGIEANASSRSVVISADGLYVVFNSKASNLAINDDNSHYDIFRKNLVTDEVVLVSADVSGIIGNRESSAPDISTDGRYVVFQSTAFNLVADDTNWKYDVFVKDVLTGQIKRTSVNDTGIEANGESRYPSISDNGRFVVFYSDANNLSNNDYNTMKDVYRAEILLAPMVITAEKTK